MNRHERRKAAAIARNAATEAATISSGNGSGNGSGSGSGANGGSRVAGQVGSTGPLRRLLQATQRTFASPAERKVQQDDRLAREYRRNVSKEGLPRMVITAETDQFKRTATVFGNLIQQPDLAIRLGRQPEARAVRTVDVIRPPPGFRPQPTHFERWERLHDQQKRLREEAERRVRAEAVIDLTGDTDDDPIIISQGTEPRLAAAAPTESDLMEPPQSSTVSSNAMISIKEFEKVMALETKRRERLKEASLAWEKSRRGTLLKRTHLAVWSRKTKQTIATRSRATTMLVETTMTVTATTVEATTMAEATRPTDCQSKTSIPPTVGLADQEVDTAEQGDLLMVTTPMETL